MNDIRRYINILENASQDELQKYRDEVAYWKNERKKYWPVSAELLAQYNDGSHTEKDSDGDLCWYQNGKLHRDGDKPAFIYSDGGLSWLKNDLWHRDGDKPAIIRANGHLEWWKNGLSHRFGGPAVIYQNGKLEWYWRGEEIPVKSQAEFIEYLKTHKGLQQFRVNKS